MDRDDDVLADTIPETAMPPTSSGGSRWSLPGYDLGALLGKGGMGEVLLARDPEIGRDIAIKRLADPDASPESVARFLREAKIQARLEHPAIVPVHQIGHDAEGRPYFTMKRVTGRTLFEVLRDRTTTLQAQLRALVDVCLAIELAHENGVVHRDLKPANVLIGDFGEVYVIDWGLARVLGDGDSDNPRTSDIASAPGHTQVGALLGTPGYMAPEQVRGTPVDRAADVYALGAMLFEILAGEPLHPRGEAIGSTLDRPTRAPGTVRPVPPELDAICVAALAESPDERPRARTLADRIQEYLDGDRDLERRRTLAAAELDRARAAALDPGRRAEATQAAGRALALDPASSDASALVTDLVVRPPAVLPDELVRRLDEVDRDLSLRSAKLARIALLGMVVLVPSGLLMGITSWVGFLGLLGLGVAMCGYAHYQVVSRHTNDLAMLALDVVLIVSLSRILGSFIFVPGVVCVIGHGLGQQAQMLERRWMFSALLIGAYLLPLGLEAVGVFSETVALAGDQLVLTSPIIHATAPLYPVLIAGNVLVIFIAVVLGQHFAVSHRTIRREVEIQAWQLRQLVPELAR